MTTVVNLRLEKCDVKVCRGTIFGNPYEIGIDGDRDQVIERYQKWFNFMLRDPIFYQALYTLKNKRLGCFCKQKDREVKCHADTIADFVNNNLLYPRCENL